MPMPVRRCFFESIFGFDGVEVESVGEEWLERGVLDDMLDPAGLQARIDQVGECFQILNRPWPTPPRSVKGLFGGDVAPACRGSYESAVWRLEVRVLVQAQGLRRCGRHRCNLSGGWPACRLSGPGPWGRPLADALFEDAAALVGVMTLRSAATTFMAGTTILLPFQDQEVIKA